MQIATILVLLACVALVPAKTYDTIALKTNMPYAVSDHTATSFNSNTHLIYLFGGCTGEQSCVGNSCSCTTITNQCVRYNPSLDTYTILSTAPTARYRHMATAVGKFLWIIGGRNLDDDIISAVHKYDTETDTWTTAIANFAEASSDGAAFTVGSDIYVISGYDQTYSTAQGTLIKIDSSSLSKITLAPMSTSRGDFSIVKLHGIVYVVGGWKFDDFCTPSRVVEAYNPSTNTWTTKTPMILGRGDFALGVMGGHIFAIGGETKDTPCELSLPIDDVERYDPDADSWFVEEDLDFKVFRFVGATDNTSDVTELGIYLFGGQTTYSGSKHRILNKALKYAPSSAWTSAPLLSLATLLAFVVRLIM